MADKSKIEWTDATWNAITGCSHVSEGCRFCYAERDSKRWGYSKLPWTKENASKNIILHPERLDQPIRWKKPRRIFVNSVSDLFHENIPIDFIAKVFAVMAATPEHIFQVLTKRAGNMKDLCNDEDFQEKVWIEAGAFTHAYDGDWPLPNVWLGISAEDQKNANERIPLLQQTPAAIRWVSAEPLLGEINLEICEHEGDEYGDGAIYYNMLSGERWMKDGFEKELYSKNKIDWVVVGGESGAHARPMHPDWARSLRDQCIRADVKFFFKQWGEYIWRETWGDSTGKKHIFDDGVFVNRVGKKNAGRILDGKIWDEFPNA